MHDQKWQEMALDAVRRHKEARPAKVRRAEGAAARRTQCDVWQVANGQPLFERQLEDLWSAK